jgi:argininosuccinate lyase
LDLALISVRVMQLVVTKIKPDAKRLREGFTPDIYATDRALELVAKGMTFRDAYRLIGNELGTLEKGDPDLVIRRRTYSGTTGNLGLDNAKKQLEQWRDQLVSREEWIGGKLQALVGFEVSLYR